MINRYWKIGAAAMMLSVCVLQGGAYASDTSMPATSSVYDAAASTPQSNYGLTQEIRAAIKSISVESTSKGLQLSAVVRLYNGGTNKNRVPEHELHLRTADGLEYALTPSATNKKSLVPKEVSELVYMAIVDGNDQPVIDQLSFDNVDVYSYPKKITNLLTIPVTSEVWYQGGGYSSQQESALAWGQAFKLPGVNSDIVYTPVSISEQSTASGPVKVVTLLAENQNYGRENIPKFRVDASTETKRYEGITAETNATALERGEKQYLHFTIPVEAGTSVTNLLMMTVDSFVGGDGQTPTVLSSGKLAMNIPSVKQVDSLPAVTYTIGSPIAFDPLTKVIDSNTEISMVELHLHENMDSGFKTAIAKFKFKNNSDLPILTPSFQTQLTGENGVTYSGTRQTSVTETLDPGLSYVVSYSFNLPQSEKGEHLTMKLLDAKAAAPYVTSIASLQTETQIDEAGKSFSLYPFDITLNDYSVSYTTKTGAGIVYTYKINLDLDIKQTENVVVDSNFSMLRFEVVDPQGRVVGTTDVPFTGEKKLISGKQKIDSDDISSDQFATPITVNMYEVIKTPTGEAKRLLNSFKQ